MKRVALLIESSRVSHPSYIELPGARRDVVNFNQWLTSDAGGAWSSDEIQRLSTPTANEIRIAMFDTLAADYAFIFFSGHGGTTKKGSHVVCQKGEELETDVLKGLAARTTVIVDACRSFDEELLEEEELKKAFARADMALDSAARVRHRLAFDRGVEQAEKGAVFLFGCSEGEAAVEHSDGGWFSINLLKGARQWSVGARVPGSYSVLDAIRYTDRQRSGQDQQPRIEGSIRRNRFFPFAVRA